MTVPGITRLDSDRYRVHGYRVRLHWHKGKPRLNGWFPDLKHGSKAKALRAATAFVRAQPNGRGQR